MVPPGPAQDWGSIDESNKIKLKNDIPRVPGSRKEYNRLNKALDTMLETKREAMKSQIHVPGLPYMLEKYFEVIAQGQQLSRQSWWKKLQNMGDWKDSKDEFKGECERVWQMVHNTSFAVHKKATMPQRRTSQVSTRRYRSLERLDRTEPSSVTGQTQQGDTFAICAPASAGLVPAQNSTGITTAGVSASPIQYSSEETVKHIVDRTATRTLELFLERGIIPGVPRNLYINNFEGCVVRPSGRTVPTVNIGGRSNQGAVVNPPLTPSEAADGNSSDEDSMRDTMDLD